MAEWGAIAVSWPDDGYTVPLVTFDLPTGFPPTDTVGMPSRAGYTDPLAAPPQPQARNLEAPRARWRGTGLFQVDAHVDGELAGSTYKPWPIPPAIRLWGTTLGSIDWTVEHDVFLRAWSETRPPHQWDIYGGVLLNGDEIIHWYSFINTLRRELYPIDYPAGQTDAYGDPISAADFEGGFGANAPYEVIPPRTYYPALGTLENPHAPAERASADSPTMKVRAPASSSGGGDGGGTGGTGGGGGTGGTGGGDAEPPSAPGTLTGSYSPNPGVVLAWGAATDNIAVVGYRVYRDGLEIGTTATTTFEDTAALPGSSPAYTVRAYDAAGNLGPASNIVTVSVPPAPSSEPAPETIPTSALTFGLRTFALDELPAIIIDAAAGDEPADGTTGGDRSFQGVPGGTGTGNPKATAKPNRFEPAYRMFWQQLLVTNRSKARQIHRLLRRSRAASARRRR